MERTPDREWFEKVDSACSYVAYRKLQRLDPLREELIEISRDAQRFAEAPEPEPQPGYYEIGGSRFPGDSRAGTFAGSPTHEPDDDPGTGWLAAICPHGMVTGGAGYRTAEERLRVSEMLEGAGRHIVEYPVGPVIQFCSKCISRDIVEKGLADREAL